MSNREIKKFLSNNFKRKITFLNSKMISDMTISPAIQFQIDSVYNWALARGIQSNWITKHTIYE